MREPSYMRLLNLRCLVLAATCASAAACGDPAMADADATGGGEESSSGASATSAGESGNGDTGEVDPLPSGSVLAIGDSVLEWNADSAESIPDVVGQMTGFPVTNNAVSGAMMLGPGDESIASQYVANDWAWVLIDGGVNDVGPDSCGCGDCLPMVDQLISGSLDSGAMPTLVDTAVADGAWVVLLGYYSLPSGETEFDGCEEELSVLNNRYRDLAVAREHVLFVDMTPGMDFMSNPEVLDEDGIHPSAIGSAAVGALVAAVMVQ